MVDEHSAIVRGRNMPISTKHAIEISNAIRGKSVKASKEFLGKVLEKKVAVPFKRFNFDLGHKKGRIAAGRFPQKSTQHVLQLLNTLEANASNKGLDAESLYIKTIIPNKASTPQHSGRHTRRKMKRTHLEIIGEELIEKKTTKESKKQEQPKEQKKEVKQVEVKEEKATEVKKEEKVDVKGNKK